MDSTSVETPVVDLSAKSRLPAGSTLEVFPGVHVPHPHAQPNLPGAGDPRLGDTNAVTEFVKFETSTVDKAEDATTKEVVTATVEQKPLPEEVKAKVVTTAASLPAVAGSTVEGANGEHLAVAADNITKTA